LKTEQPGDYYIRLDVTCPPEFADILIAELAEAGFAMFLETEHGIEADAEGTVDLAMVESIRLKYNALIPVSFLMTTTKKENWNELWEKNVSPVVVDGQCLIRASFHPKEPRYPYEIVITPKMSFGTGHHPTTYLMLKNQLSMNHQDKRVMDAGCGTAILSIMASKRGAREVEAFDIDEWSLTNGRENAALNHCDNINIRQGTIKEFTWPSPFDIILANINRNILLAEMSLYAQNLVPAGVLLLSGFYVRDIPQLVAEGERHGLTRVGHDEREEWAALRLVRTGN